MEGLIHRGLLHTWTSTEKWLLLGEEELPSPPDGYVVLFAHFHERGFMTPAHRFLRWLQLALVVVQQRLNPNRI